MSRSIPRARPDGYTGAQLVFEGGSLILDFRKNGGHFAFTDDELEPVREYDEDGVWDGFLAKLPYAELEAIRDFLNKWLPPAESGAHSPSEASAATETLDDPILPSGGAGELREKVARIVRWAVNGALCNPAELRTDVVDHTTDAILSLLEAPTPSGSISTDGPHEITEHRRWLARQLIDSKLSDEEAYGIVRHSPAVTPSTDTATSGEGGA